jgi:hypothetical protein
MESGGFRSARTPPAYRAKEQPADEENRVELTGRWTRELVGAAGLPQWED